MNTAAAERDLLLLAVDYPPSHGGIQTLTHEIYSRLADRIRIVVAPATPRGITGFADPLPLVRTHCAAGTGWDTLRFLRAAEKALARRRLPAPALLHCNHLFGAYAGWHLRRRFGLPYLVWAHGEELTKHRWPGLAGRALRAAVAVLVNSEFTAAQVHQLAGSAVPTIKIPLGTSASWWETPSTAAPDPACFTVLTVARLSRRDRYKGLDTALAAVAHLRQQGVPVRYRIAGHGDDRAWLEQRAAEFGVRDQVEFLGSLPPAKLLEAYDSCDAFLLCSREQPSPRGLGFEGFGIALLEASARGKPVVGGRSGGIPDAVVDGVTGLLCDPNDPAAVAGALHQLAQDPALRRQLGTQGRERVRTRMNWDEAAAQVRRVHLQLVASA